jgi:SecD/SecF fusion protein
VADEAKWNTFIALGFSVLGIMAYIWVRFGNFKYGTATVVACIHDALFVLSAIGFTLYLGNVGFFENALLIKPFRMDLTLVAAILTVVGYSMNDTVVVFDRIRENRGKFGVMSRQVINDSINQTLSRTLLTGGTSIGILGVMYVIGGEGIHGFTFAMLLGIIVGTYSSMVIAAPLLLVGKSVDEPATLSRPTGANPQVAG